MLVATFYDRINTIYQFVKLSWIINCLFLRNMVPLSLENSSDSSKKQIFREIVLFYGEMYISSRKQIFREIVFFLW